MTAEGKGELTQKFIEQGADLLKFVDEVVDAYGALKGPDDIPKLYAACHNLKEFQDKTRAQTPKPPAVESVDLSMVGFGYRSLEEVIRNVLDRLRAVPPYDEDDPDWRLKITQLMLAVGGLEIAFQKYMADRQQQ